jgi:hypothetical protein
VKIHQATDLAEVENLLREVGSMEAGVKLMASKAIGIVVELGELSPSMGNIIKQEALAVGADAAVHEKTSQCEIEKTKVTLVGSLKQLRILALKLQKNVAILPELGKGLKNVLNERFPE